MCKIPTDDLQRWRKQLSDAPKGQRCDTCDRPNCPRYVGHVCDRWEVAEGECSRCTAAEHDCFTHRVDWRRRALEDETIMMMLLDEIDRLTPLTAYPTAAAETTSISQPADLLRADPEPVAGSPNYEQKVSEWARRQPPATQEEAALIGSRSDQEGS